MPKIRYLHKTREGISSIYPKKSGDILQNMNFSRYYRNRGKFIYGFDPNIIKLTDMQSKIFLTTPPQISKLYIVQYLRKN